MCWVVDICGNAGAIIIFLVRIVLTVGLMLSTATTRTALDGSTLGPVGALGKRGAFFTVVITPRICIVGAIVSVLNLGVNAMVE